MSNSNTSNYENAIPTPFQRHSNAIPTLMALALLIFLSCESEKIESPILDSETSSSKIDKTSTGNADMNHGGDPCGLTVDFGGEAIDGSTGLPWTQGGENVFRFKWVFNTITCNSGTIESIYLEFRTLTTLTCEGNPSSYNDFGQHLTNISYTTGGEYFYNPVGDVITDKIFQYRTVITLDHCAGQNVRCSYITDWDGPLCTYMWE